MPNNFTTKFITVSGTVLVAGVPNSGIVDIAYLKSGIWRAYPGAPYCYPEDSSFARVLEDNKDLEYTLCTDDFLYNLLSELPYYAPYIDDIPNYNHAITYESTRVEGSVV